MVCVVPTSNNTKEDKQEVDNSKEVYENKSPINVMDNDGLKFTRVAGGSLIDHPPLFSPDGESLYVISKNIIQVFSTTTGERLKDFDIGTTNKLIGLEFDLNNPKILIGCSETGEIVHWKCKNGSLESKGKLQLTNFKLQSFNLLDIWSNSPCALITFTVPEIRKIQFAIIDIINGKNLNCPLDISLTGKKLKVITETQNFHYFAFSQADRLHIIQYKTWQYKMWKNANKSNFTCLLSHPIEEMIATGDDMGRIFLWRELWSPKDCRTTLYHWHHTPITSLSFTDSGTGFYSGGQEAVLVKWKLSRPDLREYLPRMISTIVHITNSKKNSKVAVCTSDNGIQILGGQNQTKCVLQNFTFVTDNKTGLSKYPIGLQLNPRTNNLVLNGRIGHLQFFSTYTKSLLYNMDIVVQNRLSLEAKKILYDIRVTQADFNNDWMVTGEVWDDQEHVPELRIKFWKYQNEKQMYSLNTNIELPHELGFKIIKFSSPFQVDNLLCASVGYDNVIKIWSLEDSANIYKKGKVWFCIAQTKYKNLDIHSIDFSEDGSSLAAGYGNNLCVYRSDSLKLKAVLSPPTGYDGAVQKIQICLPNNEKSPNHTNKINKSFEHDKCKKIMESFTKFINNCDTNLLQEIRNKKLTSNKSNNNNTVRKTINKKNMEILFKKIHAMTELNLFQKIALYQKLKIFCNSPEDKKSRLLDYLNSTTFKYTKIEKKLCQFINFIGIRDRFKAKFRMKKLLSRKRNYNINVNDKLISLLDLLDLNQYKNNKKHKLNNICNGHQSEEDEDHTKDNVIIPQVHNIAQIKSVHFATGEFSHLVIVCTEHRVLIWNLLTLKIQCVLKISVEKLVIDYLTSLCAAFTTHNELYIFQPNALMSLYHRVNLPNILGLCWVPRRNPKMQTFDLDWQAISTLYFLTENQELIYLSSEKDDDSMLTSAVYLNDSQEIVRYSIFGAYARKVNNTKLKEPNINNTTIGIPGKSSVKSIIEMAAHTMAPVNILCNKFVKSLLITSNTEKNNTLINEDNAVAKVLDGIESDDESNELNTKIKLRKIIAEKSKLLKVNKTYAIENLKQEQELDKIFTQDFSVEF